MFIKTGWKCTLQLAKSHHPLASGQLNLVGNHLNLANSRQPVKNYCQQQPLTYLERKMNRQNLTEHQEENETDRLLKAHQFRKPYDTHQQLNTFQTFLLAVGSSIGALVDPYRDDLVAISSETVIGQNALRKLYERMSRDEEASRILADRPRINSIEVDLERLAKLPVNTLGYQYVTFLNDNNITCDSRKPVKYVDDANLAYVLQRYREVHDFTHLLFDMRTTILGEVVIKWVEAIQTEIPMCIGAAILGPVRLYPKQRELFKRHYLDWAIENARRSKPTLLVYFEERWEQDIDELRKELNILPPPKVN